MLIKVVAYLGVLFVGVLLGVSANEKLKKEEEASSPGNPIDFLKLNNSMTELTILARTLKEYRALQREMALSLENEEHKKANLKAIDECISGDIYLSLTQYRKVICKVEKE